MGLNTFVLINFVISYEKNIYENTENDISSEYRGNLIKLYEYLRWDERYGLFKFLFAPLNILQIPFTILIIFLKEDNINWTRIFTKILYFPICVFYFAFYFIYHNYQLFLAIFQIIFIYPFKYNYHQKMKNPLLRIILGIMLIEIKLYLMMK